MDPARVIAALLKPAAAAVAVAAVSAGLVIGVRSLNDNGGGPDRLVPAAGRPQVVFAVYDEKADTIYSAPVDDLSARTTIASAPHAPGFGINGSLSPDGRRIAYTALPAGAARPAPDAPADVRVVESGAAPRLLVAGADLLVAPVWAPDGRSLVVRRSQPAEDAAGTFQLVRVDVGSGDETTLVQETDGLFPIAFTPDGASLYYARLSPAGTDLVRIAAGGGEGQGETVAHLSDDVARDWRLSPDGARLSYLVQVLEGDRYTFVARVLDLTGSGLGGLEALNRTEPGAADEFSPVWWPDGSKVVLGRASGSAPAPARVIAGNGADSELAPLDHGFDVPLSVAPGGSYVAVRSFQGGTAQDPGPSVVQLVGSDGRVELADQADVAVLGWVE